MTPATDLFNTQFVQWLATLGVGGVLAAFIFFWYRKDVKQYTDMWRGQSDALMTVVKENTKAITENTLTIQALHRRDDRIEGALQKLGFGFIHREAHRDDS